MFIAKAAGAAALCVQTVYEYSYQSPCYQNNTFLSPLILVGCQNKHFTRPSSYRVRVWQRDFYQPARVVIQSTWLALTNRRRCGRSDQHSGHASVQTSGFSRNRGKGGWARDLRGRRQNCLPRYSAGVKSRSVVLGYPS